MMNEENAPKVITTEDKVDLVEGDRAYNYYDMKAGTIGPIDGYYDGLNDTDPWFDFIHDDDTKGYLNGSRICSIGFATRKGWVK